MICQVCKKGRAFAPSSVCSLKCATELVGDYYPAVRARFTNAVAEAKLIETRGTRKRYAKADKA